MVVNRLDNRGLVKWSKRYGSVESNDLSEIVLGSDGSIGLIGRAKFDGSTYGIHLATVSIDGAILLSKVYHFLTVSTGGYKLNAFPDGGYLIICRGRHAPSTIYKLTAFKMNNAGDIEWGLRMDDKIENIDKYNYVRDAAVLPNGDIGLVGYVDHFNSSLDDSFVIKLNSNG